MRVQAEIPIRPTREESSIGAANHVVLPAAKATHRKIDGSMT